MGIIGGGDLESSSIPGEINTSSSSSKSSKKHKRKKRRTGSSSSSKSKKKKGSSEDGFWGFLQRQATLKFRELSSDPAKAKRALAIFAFFLGTVLILASSAVSENSSSPAPVVSSQEESLPQDTSAASSSGPRLRGAAFSTANAYAVPSQPTLGALYAVERAHTDGWNRSNAVVVPLGQLGYVKRDLPVYKPAFIKAGFDVIKRPEKGMWPSSKITADASVYGVMLCLSFNNDHCFDPSMFPSIPRDRKINRLYNLRDILWSKNKFCATVGSSLKGLPEKFQTFTFPCWVMPGKYSDLVSYANAKTTDDTMPSFIVKPRSLGAGMGIYVVDNMDDLRALKGTQHVVQTYLGDPHLINERKWDMRTYVLCTSVSPLRAYVYNRGLVRFATSKYDPDAKAGGDKTQFLTNTSVNKHAEGAKLKDITWSFKKLKKYFETEEDQDFAQVMLRVQRAIGLTLLSSESTFRKHLDKAQFKCTSCYQLLGVDVIFDSALNPRVIEVNGEPSMRLTSIGKTHYDYTKKSMARALVGIVYQKKSGANILYKRLSKAAEGDGKKVNVPKEHAPYLLNTVRERLSLGGFLPVYPNKNLDGEYDEFLSELHEKEKTSGKGPHADGSRLSLHRLISKSTITKKVTFPS